MIYSLYIIFLIITNILEFKKLEKITNDELFYVLSLDTLSFSLFMFYVIYKNIGLSFINAILLTLLLFLFNKEKCSLFKTALLLLNIFIIFKILF